MPIELDHLILAVNDRDETVAFYTEVLGLSYDGEAPPFSVLRVTEHFTLQIAPWGTSGGEHLAFALDCSEFDEVFAHVRAAGIPYGDSFHDVGNMRGPGEEPGARGLGPALYFFDPSQHLLEIRHYAA